MTLWLMFLNILSHLNTPWFSCTLTFLIIFMSSLFFLQNWPKNLIFELVSFTGITKQGSKICTCSRSSTNRLLNTIHVSGTWHRQRWHGMCGKCKQAKQHPQQHHPSRIRFIQETVPTNCHCLCRLLECIQHSSERCKQVWL